MALYQINFQAREWGVYQYSQGLWRVADAISGLSTSRAIFAGQDDDFTKKT